MPNALLAALGILFLVSLLVSLLLTPWIRRCCLRWGLVDHPGERKIHATPMPYGGGIVIYFVSVVGILASYGILLLGDRILPWPSFWVAMRPHLPGLFFRETLLRLGGILAGGTLIFFLGLLDDRQKLAPLPKLLIQIAAALIVIASGVRATIFIEDPLVGKIVTLFWIVAVTNAFNLLDNMDGLSSGVAAIGTALFFVIAIQTGQLFVAAFLVLLLGALLGFLFYNFPPAKLFLGDAGSLLIGFLLGTLTITGTFYAGKGSIFAVTMPVLILGVPLFDTASVIAIRLWQGRPIYIGDTSHLSHRLVRLGMTRRMAVLTIYVLGLILGGAATLLRQLDEHGAGVVLLLGFSVILLLVLLEVAAAGKGKNHLED